MLQSLIQEYIKISTETSVRYAKWSSNDSLSYWPVDTKIIVDLFQSRDRSSICLHYSKYPQAQKNLIIKGTGRNEHKTSVYWLVKRGMRLFHVFARIARKFWNIVYLRGVHGIRPCLWIKCLHKCSASSGNSLLQLQSLSMFSKPNTYPRYQTYQKHLLNL